MHADNQVSKCNVKENHVYYSALSSFFVLRESCLLLVLFQVFFCTSKRIMSTIICSKISALSRVFFGVLSPSILKRTSPQK